MVAEITKRNESANEHDEPGTQLSREDAGARFIQELNAVSNTAGSGISDLPQAKGGTPAAEINPSSSPSLVFDRHLELSLIYLKSTRIQQWSRRK